MITRYDCIIINVDIDEEKQTEIQLDKIQQDI